jgi:hypothetical protein
MTLIRAVLRLPPTNVNAPVTTAWDTMFGTGAWQQHVHTYRAHVDFILGATHTAVQWAPHLPNTYADADEQLRLLDTSPTVFDPVLADYYNFLRLQRSMPANHPVNEAWDRMCLFIQRYYTTISPLYLYHL